MVTTPAQKPCSGSIIDAIKAGRKNSAQLFFNQEESMKAMSKAQKKVGSVMKEFGSGKLHSGKGGPVVKNPKQAIAIALSQAKMPMRGQRTATNKAKK
jgi:hypothetical protein